MKTAVILKASGVKALNQIKIHMARVSPPGMLITNSVAIRFALEYAAQEVQKLYPEDSPITQVR